MTGFQLKNGDVVIENNEIQMVSDAELIRQTVETVLNTNKGEWFFDEDEGINFDNILGKKKKIKDNGNTSDYYNDRLEKRLDGVL